MMITLNRPGKLNAYAGLIVFPGEYAGYGFSLDGIGKVSFNVR